MTACPSTTLPPKAGAVFILTLALGSVLLFFSLRDRTELERLTTERIMTERAQNITEVLTRLIYKTQTLAALVIQHNGEINEFELVAATIIDDPAIMNLLLAPGGVVTQVYPLAGNEAVLGLNLLGEGAGNREAVMAKDQGRLVFGGPFTTVQGHQALVGRLPVYLPTRDGGKRFWGLASVTLRHPEAFAGTTLAGLGKRGYDFELWRVNPDDGQRQVILTSDPGPDPKARFIEIPVSIHSAEWRLRLSPVYKWYEHPGNWGLIGVILLISFLAAFLTRQNQALRQMQHTLEDRQQKLSRAAATALEASRLKSAFLANMSHEIRTPMNGIIGFAELAIEDERVPGKTRRFLSNIKSSAEGLQRLLGDILDLSRIESGRVELETVPFRLPDLLDQCQALITPPALEKGLEVYFGLHPRPEGHLGGDLDKLRRVLLNLLFNAVKFTSSGAVKLMCHQEAANEKEARFRFEVIDSGIGISADQLTRIFEPFSQVDQSTTRQYGGAGLGLPLSKRLIELMGGTLEVETRLDLGSRFHFTLTFPRLEPPPTAASPTARPTFVGRVLVCEDNSINQEVITEHLSGVGLTTEIAVNGRQGVEMAGAAQTEGRPYDLILMDIHMPEMDGLEAAEKMRALGLTSPIIALTANTSPADQASYQAAGLVDCLGKPFKGRDLWAMLLKHLTPATSGEPRPAQAAGPSPTPLADGLEHSPVIDPALGLEQAAGNPALYERLLGNFLKDNVDKGREIEGALAAGDVKTAARLAHTLKGVAGTIGAGALSQAALAVEEALAEARPDLASDRRPALDQALTKVLDELRPLAQPAAAEPEAGTATADPAATRALAARLVPLLAAGASESLELLREVRQVFGPLGERGQALAGQIEEYDFDLAAETLAGLMKDINLEQNN